MWQRVQTVGILLVFIYFIHEQFKYSVVNRWSYWFMPIFSLVQFSIQMTWNEVNEIKFGLILVVSLLVGYFQAKYTKIQIGKAQSAFFEYEKEEVTLYKKVARAKGGYPYLIGWLVIMAMQVILAFWENQHAFSTQELVSEIYEEVIRDLVLALRFTDSADGAWYVWAITGLSSLSYILFLARRSPIVKHIMFKSEKIYDLQEEINN